MDGPAPPVVRAYEEYTRRLENEAAIANPRARKSILADHAVQQKTTSGGKGAECKCRRSGSGA